jgi:hypothetical protein
MRIAEWAGENDLMTLEDLTKDLRTYCLGTRFEKRSVSGEQVFGEGIAVEVNRQGHLHFLMLRQDDGTLLETPLLCLYEIGEVGDHSPVHTDVAAVGGPG